MNVEISLKKEDLMNLEKHLFICTRCTTPTGQEGEGLQLQKSLKSYFKKNHSDKLIRVNKSGCLGKCSTGVNAVCYPEGRWFEKLSLDDEDNLKKSMIE